ncbi:Nitrogen permease regulator 2 [Haplosporangium sp. Z 767]|nr:Nitrogen permease regulator 2 [Haplosporangium sp. Z 767]KAF9196314.1 Nitrogen permease regulator 2 [Haplosporangium sp. Z 11]
MGFPRLLSIFYCTFHPTQGPKVLYEVPEGSILSKTSPLVDFDSISEFLIPKVELCAKLVTISTPTCKVIGFPVNLEHKKFQRNALMFNLAFVFDKDAEISSYEPVVRKMARVLKALEKESEFLSRQTRAAMMDNGAQSIAASALVAASVAPALAYTGNNASSTTSAETHPTGSNSILDTVTEATASISVAEANQNTLLQGVFQSANGASTPFASSPSTTSTLTVPAEKAGTQTSDAIATPFLATTASSNSITSTTLVSSPPSTGNNSFTAVITAPPSASPFPQSRSASNSSTTNNTANGVSSAQTSQKTTPSSSPSLVEQAQAGSGMQNLIEQLIEDLNSYCECQIPIDSANTINLKLFPTYPNPAPVYDYQVPISTVNLEALTDVNWDMTMQRITGYINGVNSVKRIADYADVETGLARMCMEHLLYYGCIIMVDLFQFKNIYAVKMEMMRLTEDVAMQCECVAYVTLPEMHAPSFAKIFSLYCSLQYGVVLQDWIEQNQLSDYNIDVRRFISFGVIKGFLYRVHKYPILDYHDPSITSTKADQSAATTSSSMPSTPATITAALTPSTATTATTVVTSRPETPSTVPPTPKKVYGDTLAPSDQHVYLAQNQHSSQQQQPHHQQTQHANEQSSSSVVIPPALRKLLNGEHHYDELCTQFGCSVREMDQILGTDSRVKFIYR